MALDPRNRAFTLNAGAAAQAGIDEGLRSYMLRVYNYMGSGLALTGIVAVIVAQMSMQLDPSGRLVGLTEL